MSRYIVNLQVYANFTATVNAENDEDAYEKAQNLAKGLSQHNVMDHNDDGTVSLAVNLDDVNNPISEDIQKK